MLRFSEFPTAFFRLIVCGLSMWQHGRMNNFLCWELGVEAGLLGEKNSTDTLLYLWFGLKLYFQEQIIIKSLKSG